MATKSVPTVVSASPTFMRLSLSMMDAGGEKRSISLQVPAATSDAVINDLIDTTQAITNATIYECRKTLVFSSVPVEANADTTPHVSVYDNLVLLAKNVTTQKAQDGFVPAVKGILILDGDTVDTTDLDYIAWKDAVVAALGAGYAAVTARFTERRDKNDSVPA